MMCVSCVLANAQSKSYSVEYPSEWGELVSFYEIPVPCGAGYELAHYTMIHTHQGVGFIGKDKNVKYFYTPEQDTKINGAFFNFVDGKWVFTPAYCECSRRGAVWFEIGAKKPTRALIADKQSEDLSSALQYYMQDGFPHY